MNEWRVTFTCELLEDMHAGSGLGFRGIIDDRHARACGVGLFWRTTRWRACFAMRPMSWEL